MRPASPLDRILHAQTHEYALHGICSEGHTQAVLAFEALAEPQRRRILVELGAAERPVGELVTALRLTQPAVSKHLRVLRDAGLVEARIDAQRRLYRVRPEGLREVDDWLLPFRRLWVGPLDALERHLDAHP
jgi:DNA-binding transcriptional ArsR family regulator